jgi:hypothetical protein
MESQRSTVHIMYSFLFFPKVKYLYVTASTHRNQQCVNSEAKNDEDERLTEIGEKFPIISNFLFIILKMLFLSLFSCGTSSRVMSFFTITENCVCVFTTIVK